MRQGRLLLYQTVVNRLMERIARGDLKPGDRLPSIKELAAEFSVSVASVREAIRTLEEKGLLSAQQGRGVFLARVQTTSPDKVAEAFHALDKTSFLDLLEMRLILEPETAALSARRAAPEMVERIVSNAAEMQRLVERGDDFTEVDLAFHQFIAESTRNTVLLRLHASLAHLLLDSRRVTNYFPGMPPRSARYHSLIAEAIQKRQPDQARLLMRAHIQDVVLTIRDNPEWAPLLTDGAGGRLTMDEVIPSWP